MPGLTDLDAEIDLVMLGVGDSALPEQMHDAASIGARSAVVYGSAHGHELRHRIATTARDAGMALCGAGCMGFLNVRTGLRALGYLERADLRAGPVSLITHSGSMFSTVLRTRQRLSYDLAVSSGQELVTTTADYVDYIVTEGGTRVLALILETVRDGRRLRESLHRARSHDIEVVILATGGSPAGSAMVAAHSGAVAGDFATWDALCADLGAVRASDLAECADLIELLANPRRTAHAGGRGLATAHDSGAERTMTVDLATQIGTPLADLTPETRSVLAEHLDEGLEPTNPLDIWGAGRNTRALFRNCLHALSDDPSVGATALAVDLVPEYDGDTDYADAVVDVASATEEPIVVLANLASAIDPNVAHRLRGAGIPVLEGTRSGLFALRHLLDAPERRCAAILPDVHVNPARAARWRGRLGTGVPIGVDEAVALVEDYGIPQPPTLTARTAAQVRAAAEDIGWPLVLKTADPGIAHKSDVGGVVVGIDDHDELAITYADMARRLGPLVSLHAMAAPGVELSVGVIADDQFGPMVVVAAGGVLIEVIGDAATALPPIDADRARDLVNRLTIRRLLDRHRGRPGVDREALGKLIVAVAQIAIELDGTFEAIEFNPVIARPAGVVAADVLISPRTPSHQDRTAACLD